DRIGHVLRMASELLRQERFCRVVSRAIFGPRRFLLTPGYTARRSSGLAQVCPSRNLSRKGDFLALRRWRDGKRRSVTLSGRIDRVFPGYPFAHGESLRCPEPDRSRGETRPEGE